MSRKLFGCTFGMALAAVCASAGAQDAVLSQFYGNGVHAYFAGNYSQARQELTTAINSGSKDPRAYYFRALANLKHGLEDEARADFERGAALESSSNSRTYPVSKSLERIQGSDRLTLERYRSVARATAVARQERRMQARYEALRRSEGDKLRRVARPRIEQAQPAAAVEPLRQPLGDAAMAKGAAEAAQPAGDDPFATDTAPPAPTDTPMGSDVADPANPFGDSALEEGGAPAADAADPFGGADAAPAPAPMPDAGDASDPFGADAPLVPADAPAGAAEPATPDASDPFADDAAMKADEKPADAKPADAGPADAAPESAEAENPFGS